MLFLHWHKGHRLLIANRLKMSYKAITSVMASYLEKLLINIRPYSMCQEWIRSLSTVNRYWLLEHGRCSITGTYTRFARHDVRPGCRPTPSSFNWRSGLLSDGQVIPRLKMFTHLHPETGGDVFKTTRVTYKNSAFFSWRTHVTILKRNLKILSPDTAHVYCWNHTKHVLWVTSGRSYLPLQQMVHFSRLYAIKQCNKHEGRCVKWALESGYWKRKGQAWGRWLSSYLNQVNTLKFNSCSVSAVSIYAY